MQVSDIFTDREWAIFVIQPTAF